MRVAAVLVLTASALLLAGCGNGTSQGAAPTVEPSRSTTASPTPTSTPSPMPTVVMPTEEPDTSGTPTSPDVPPAPAPAVTLGPDEVDPADYPSRAVDSQNGGIPLPGVEFLAADGRIICGILTSGHFSAPGTASCTVDSYREIFPQPFPDTGPYVQSVMVDPVVGSSGLYPDWFAQPTRDIPVLANGKVIRLDGTECRVLDDTVTCSVLATGRGFVLSPTAYTLF